MGSLSPSYEGKDQRYFSGVRKDLIDRLGVDANRAILEIGCGDGSTGAYAKQQGKCGLYVGVELFPDAANVAKAVIDRGYNANIESFDIPEPPSSFDVLIAGEVLEHLVDPWVALKGMRRFLRRTRWQWRVRPTWLTIRPSACFSRANGRSPIPDAWITDPSSLVYAQILRRDVPGLGFRGRLRRAALRIRPAGQAGQQAYRRAPRAPLYWTDRCRRQECRILKERVNNRPHRGPVMILAAA